MYYMKFSFFVDDSKGSSYIQFKELNKDGKTFWIVDNYNISLPAAKVTFDYTNLFNGDKQRADSILKIWNDNWQETAVGLLVPMLDCYKASLKETTNQIFGKIPIAEIFLK